MPTHAEEQWLHADGTDAQRDDLVVVAAGYENMQESVRAIMGEDVAQKVGPIWGMDEQGELPEETLTASVPVGWERDEDTLNAAAGFVCPLATTESDPIERLKIINAGTTRGKKELLAIKVRGLSIAEVLNLTVREAFRFFRAQRQIERRLKWLLDVGLDSLRLVQLKLDVEQQLGLSLQFSQLDDNPTIAELAARIGGASDDATPPVDLRAEAVLDPEIRPPRGQAPPAATPRTILLTGATGLLGAYLLRELLDRTTAQVFCLVRAPDELAARERLWRALTRYDLWHERDAARIEPLPGDLGRPLLGLGAERFAALAASVDAIYHNGAWLSFVHTYQQLESANVDGTREILRLACHGRAKAVHYVSTASVFYGPAYDGRSMSEAEAPECPDGLDVGYVQSKWVAEQLVWEAARRGVAVNVYRPGWIFGDSRTGRVNADDFFGRLVRGCVQLGAAPRLEYVWRGAPVDDVAWAIVALATDTGASGRAFHLSAPSGVSWEQLVGWIGEAGYRLDLLPYDDWLARLRASTDNVLLPLLPFFAERATGQQLTRVQGYAERDLAKLDGSATHRALCASLPVCRPLNQELVNQYLRSYTAAGRLTI